ncbi:MAG: DUF4833 domain-containing protein [Elusimicrobiota bacterium]|nr:DUF4833 domain-containing protein [Elusimicrobiota bacterium]
MKFFFKTMLFLYVVLFFNFFAQAQPKTENLFKIERNKNANIVMYDVKTDMNGNIPTEEPIDAYWILFAKDGRREELGSIDKKAYGYKTSSVSVNSFILTLKAVPQKPIRISIVNGNPKAQIEINKRQSYLSKVYVFAKPGLIPTVLYYTLTGIDIETGKEINEQVNVVNQNK